MVVTAKIQNQEPIDSGTLTIRGDLHRDPKILKKWPATKGRVEIWYGDKKVKRGKFEFVTPSAK